MFINQRLNRVVLSALLLASGSTKLPAETRECLVGEVRCTISCSVGTLTLACGKTRCAGGCSDSSGYEVAAQLIARDSLLASGGELTGSQLYNSLKQCRPTEKGGCIVTPEDDQSIELMVLNSPTGQDFKLVTPTNWRAEVDQAIPPAWRSLNGSELQARFNEQQRANDESYRAAVTPPFDPELMQMLPTMSEAEQRRFVEDAIKTLQDQKVKKLKM